MLELLPRIIDKGIMAAAAADIKCCYWHVR